MFTITSQGLQLCILGCGVLVFIFELSAIVKDVQYQAREKMTLGHNSREHVGIVMNEEFTMKEYFAKTNRNLWYEPLAITLISVSLVIYGGYVYLADQFPTIEKSLFLVALVNGVQTFLSLYAAKLIFKSYTVYDHAYFDTFVRGLKIHYFGLEKDGYMRYSCYGGYFWQDKLSGYKHFDHDKYLKFKDSTESFRSRNHICQESGLKLTSVALLILSATFCICIQWFACCLQISPDYGERRSVKVNKVSPEVMAGGVNGYYANKAVEITQNVTKNANNETNIEYNEEVEEIAYSLSTDDDIMQFEIAKTKSSNH